MKGVKEKRCSRCNKFKPLTSEFWNRSNMYADGYRTPCKECRNEQKRINRVKNKGSTVEMEPDNPNGLDINVQVEHGRKYEIFTPKSYEDREDELFIGVLIQETENHITLKSDIGYCESFTKINISLGVHQVREVENA